jgi:cytoskeletal protein CcmA (bactofilin family)
VDIAEEAVLQTVDGMEAENGTVSEQQEDAAAQPSQNPKEKILAMLAQQKQQEEQEQPQYREPEQEDQMQSQLLQSLTENNDQEPGVTTIAKGTVIVGEINTNGDVELLGSVKGKIASKGDIRANGKVIGDLLGKDIALVSCGVQGNVIASGLVTIDEDSVVIGDVTCENFCLDGKIKGNVSVEKEAKFKPKAILAGNVTTAMIAMSQGAKIQGEVNIPLTEKETDMTFDIDINL